MALNPAISSRQRKAIDRAKHRQSRHQKAIAVAAERARVEDARQEAIAPSVRRKPILTASGEVFRHPTLEPAGTGFVYANPLQHLLAGKRARDAGLPSDVPCVNLAHMAAAQRLATAWHHGGEHVTSGVSSYGDVRGGDGAATTAMILRQIACLGEVRAAALYIGNCWRCVSTVVLEGITITAWAGLVCVDRKIAMGFLIAGLDRLVEFYGQIDAVGSGRSGMRTAEFSGGGARE